MWFDLVFVGGKSVDVGSNCVGMYVFHVVFTGVGGDEVWVSVMIIWEVVVVEDSLFLVSGVAILGCELVQWVIWML